MLADFSNLVVNEVEIETSHDTSETYETKCKTKTAAPFFEPADYLNGALYEELNYCWSQSFTEIGKLVNYSVVFHSRIIE